MTETEMKLWDAATQMKLALQDGVGDDVIRSCVNAFISNARSVTLVMQVESALHPELSDWYATESAKFKDAPLLKFFNQKRVHSIHKGVVQPTKHTMPIWNLRRKGEPALDDGSRGTLAVLVFDDIEDYMPGDSGNVFRLCEQYFAFLRMVVTYWLRKRYGLGLSVGESRLFPAITRARLLAGVTMGRYF